MEDCRSSAHQGVKHALSVLHSVSEWIGTQETQRHFWDAGTPFEDRAAELKADLDFILDELTRMGGEISKLKHTLHEHQALAHDRRNFSLTLLAAVFLPLSFASTFFGMNRNTMTSSGPGGFSNWTASWIDDSPADIQNSTRALASTIGNSGTLTYSWRTYIITAVCLVLTIPLSLTIGSILRTVYRSTTHYTTYWRLFAAFPSIGFIFCSVFGLYLSTPVFYAYNVLLLLYLCLRLDRARRTQQKRPRWLFAFILTVLSFLLSSFTSAFFMLAPWVCFAVAWLWPRWSRRADEKAREQASNINELEMTPVSASHTNSTVNVNVTDDTHPS